VSKVEGEVAHGLERNEVGVHKKKASFTTRGFVLVCHMYVQGYTR